MQMRVVIIQLFAVAAFAVFSGVAQSQQTEPLSQLHLLDLINAQNVLSILVVLVVIGAGRWFNQKGWPWLCSYLETKQSHDWELRQEQAAITREAFQIINNVSFALGEVKASIDELRHLATEKPAKDNTDDDQ